MTALGQPILFFAYFIYCMRPGNIHKQSGFPATTVPPKVPVMMWLPRPPNRQVVIAKEIKEIRDSVKRKISPLKLAPSLGCPPPLSSPSPAPPVLALPTLRPHWPHHLPLLPPVGRTSCRRLCLRGKRVPPGCTARRRAAPRYLCGPTTVGV